MDSENGALMTMVEEEDVLKQCHMLGFRDNMPGLTAAIDVASLSSSSGEGFPNGVAEAMSCGVPCVDADVGHAAHLVAHTGFGVPPKNPSPLAEAWLKMLDLAEKAEDSWA